MMIAAVIAEYNPFHNGHAYQLKEIRRQTGADLILVMMSGDFVQRGAPSCVDKYARCRMALAAGADMVCELPVYGAIGSAEIFAESAVSLLNRLGCIDYLCFGAETIAPSLFDAIIPILSDEPDEYKAFLQAGLKTGMNFPAARSRALCSILGDAQCSDILNQPNNILAIEYMKALYKSGSTIRPFPIRRSGAGYHSTDTDVGFCSATAIRRQLSKNLFSPEVVIRALDIPDTSKAILQDYLANYPVLTRNDFSDILAAHLLDTRTSLTDYTDITPDLANRIDSFRYQFLSVEQFMTLLSARNLTATRIGRCLFHIILEHRKSHLDTWKAHQYAGYLRVLGFKKSSGRLWKAIDPTFRNCMITRTSEVSGRLSDIGYASYEAELYASRLYRQILRNRSLKNLPDITSEPVILI